MSPIFRFEDLSMDLREIQYIGCIYIDRDRDRWCMDIVFKGGTTRTARDKEKSLIEEMHKSLSNQWMTYHNTEKDNESTATSKLTTEAAYRR